jgi:hypothetical protein
MFHPPPLLAYFASLTLRARMRREALTLYYDGEGLHIEVWEPCRPLLTRSNSH